MLEAIIAVIFGYLLGSIPFGLLLTRMAGIGDIRAIGSGNIGATNVLRTGNKGLALATLLLDGGKAALAVLLVRYFVPFPPMAYALAGMAAFLGHIFPVWLGFKGGKGVATYIGAMLAIAWPVGAGFCAVWLLTAITTRYSSLSALIAAIVAPVLAYFFSGPHLLSAAIPMSAILIYKHRENIKRLMSGEETKIVRSK